MNRHRKRYRRIQQIDQTLLPSTKGCTVADLSILCRERAWPGTLSKSTLAGQWACATTVTWAIFPIWLSSVGDGLAINTSSINVQVFLFLRLDGRITSREVQADLPMLRSISLNVLRTKFEVRSKSRPLSTGHPPNRPLSRTR